jgi:hypothetical protein
MGIFGTFAKVVGLKGRTSLPSKPEVQVDIAIANKIKALFDLIIARFQVLEYYDQIIQKRDPKLFQRLGFSAEDQQGIKNLMNSYGWSGKKGKIKSWIKQLKSAKFTNQSLPKLQVLANDIFSSRCIELFVNLDQKYKDHVHYDQYRIQNIRRGLVNSEHRDPYFMHSNQNIFKEINEYIRQGLQSANQEINEAAMAKQKQQLQQQASANPQTPQYGAPPMNQPGYTLRRQHTPSQQINFAGPDQRPQVNQYGQPVNNPNSQNVQPKGFK